MSINPFPVSPSNVAQLRLIQWRIELLAVLAAVAGAMVVTWLLIHQARKLAEPEATRTSHQDISARANLSEYVGDSIFD
jgi:hypothetical protein